MLLRDWVLQLLVHLLLLLLWATLQSTRWQQRAPVHHAGDQAVFYAVHCP
jgi:hypothetical protein